MGLHNMNSQPEINTKCSYMCIHVSLQVRVVGISLDSTICKSLWYSWRFPFLNPPATPLDNRGTQLIYPAKGYWRIGLYWAKSYRLLISTSIHLLIFNSWDWLEWSSLQLTKVNTNKLALLTSAGFVWPLFFYIWVECCTCKVHTFRCIHVVAVNW